VTVERIMEIIRFMSAFRKKRSIDLLKLMRYRPIEVDEIVPKFNS
jgi:hypothetical protein